MFIRSSNIMSKHILKIAVFLLALSFLIPGATSFADTGSAATYLQSHTSNEWVTMALAAAGQSPDVSYLSSFSGSSATDYEKAIMALTAVGENPSTFGSEDLVAQLRTYHTSEQIGDTSLLNDDYFGILALVSAGVATSDQAIADAKATILANQNNDGGFSWSSTGASDVDDTAAAIIALRAAGVSASDSAITDAKAYLQGAQNDDGGFPYDPLSAYGTDSNVSSTSWVLMAIAALGESPSSWQAATGNPLTFMTSLQDDGGWYHYDSVDDAANSFTPTTTAYALIAELGKTLPVGTVDATPAETQVTVSYRIEGSEDTVCEGDIQAHDAMDVVINASSVCNFTYNIDDTAYGPYLNQIADDTAEGLFGWLYVVNDDSPFVGAADYELEANDDVLWYFAEFDDTITRLTLSETELESGEALTVTVEQYVDSAWSALEGATAYVGSSTQTTDASGQASFSPADGAHTVYAEKAEYVRTEKETIIVGDSTQSAVSLTANITSSNGNNNDPQGTEDAIAFSLDLTTLDFGSINLGSSKTQSLALTNTGTVAIHVESIVSGDDVFRSYLKLAGDLWRQFATQIGIEQAETIDVTLPVPSGYSETGSQSGTLTFWATRTN